MKIRIKNLVLRPALITVLGLTLAPAARAQFQWAEATAGSNGGLETGHNYNMTSSPASGCVAPYWVTPANRAGGVTDNATVVPFRMESKVTPQLSFADTGRPTLSITNLRSGQRISNTVFTVSGKAAASGEVTAVEVQLNDGGWTKAVGTNNWSELLNLIPGANTVQAYAVDNSGNVSVTNSVNIEYILSAPLTVQIVGRGTLKPDYNAELLALGTNYTMTATAAKGFAFYYWSWGASMTNKPKLTFTMTSNLTVIANFKDVMKPMNGITFPVADQKWSNATVTVTGKASDNVGVTEVGVQINNGGWTSAQSVNGFTNWLAADLPVVSGANIVQVYAMDAAGNVSVTNTLKFFGILAPTSLAGLAAALKPDTGADESVMTFGDAGTWANFGVSGNTDVHYYSAGTYDYVQTGPDTAVLTITAIEIMSALGTTNITTIDLTFTGAATANYAWSSVNGSGSGTATFSRLDNIVPATLAGDTIQFYNSNGSKAGTDVFNSDGTFTQTKNGVSTGLGTYEFIQYSPTVAIIQQNFTDANDLGALAYAEVTFTSATAGSVFYSYYLNPVNGGAPDDIHWGTFKTQ